MGFFGDFSQKCISGQLSNTAPARNAEAIIPDDNTVYDPPLRSISVDTAGTISVLTYQNYVNGVTTPTELTIEAGILVPLFISKVFATGTDPVGITGYFP